MQRTFHATTTWEINLTKWKEPVCWLFKEPIYLSVIFMSASGLLPNVILSFSHYDVTAMPTSKLSLSRFGIHQVIAVRCHDCTTKTEWRKMFNLWQKTLFSQRREFGKKRKKKKIRGNQMQPAWPNAFFFSQRANICGRTEVRSHRPHFFWLP